MNKHAPTKTRSLKIYAAVIVLTGVGLLGLGIVSASQMYWFISLSGALPGIFLIAYGWTIFSALEAERLGRDPIWGIASLLTKSLDNNCQNPEESLTATSVIGTYKESFARGLAYWRTILLVFGSGAVSAALQAPWYSTTLICLASAFLMHRFEKVTKGASDFSTRVFLAGLTTYMLYQIPETQPIVASIRTVFF
ncbi:MAG: hypothetical protein AWU57_932 [Marinobacter sp. T13-3]|nr:MAG: hypothetical protein AWU57_932 [Marinobacter sp. T13-3]